jgi:proline iminopeptidase
MLFLSMSLISKAFAPDSIFGRDSDYITVNGAQLWYESEGAGEPLFLISGGPGNSHDYFHPYFLALRDSYRIIYFDALGRGKSDRARDRHEYTLARDVEDVKALRLRLIRPLSAALPAK